MKSIGVVIGLCVVAIGLQMTINGVDNLVHSRAFWYQWTAHIDTGLGLGLILGFVVWLRRTFPVKNS